MLDAGVKEEKISDEDDETLWDAIVTAVQAAGKVINKGVEVYAAMDRVQTTKLAENGKPYFNNYFIELAPAAAPAQETVAESEVVNAQKTEKPKAVKKTQQTQQAAASNFDDLPF